jgi:hypothetical protein
MVQETVRADSEINTSGPLAPVRLVDNAVVIVVLRRGSLDSESAE